MDSLNPIYTEKNNCQDCYKCIKVCPVKAIKFEDYSASIISQRCIWCGACVQICPSNAKRVRDDVDKVIKALRSDQGIIVSLAPSYLSEFYGLEQQTLIAAFLQAGFKAVSETALGAELVAKKAKDWFDMQKEGVYFSSCCPTTVHLIRKYYPQYTDNISPVASPVEAHATYLKENYPDYKVCFVGPCIAKKAELELKDNKIDYVLTFHEIMSLFEQVGVDFEFVKPQGNEDFFPMKAGLGNLYPIDGGMLVNMIQEQNEITSARCFNFGGHEHFSSDKDCYLTVSGVDKVREVLDDFDNFDKTKKYFIEILGCQGGCVKGPTALKKSSALIKRTHVIDKTTQYKDNPNYTQLFATNISTDFNSIEPFNQKNYTQKDIVQILKRVNKISDKDYLNCGGCGYDNCNAFAIALLDGLAENDMCVSYMRRVARDKTNILLKKMPQGVVLVDEKMRIVQANEKFAITLGKEMKELYDLKPGLAGLDITKELSFHKYFSSVLHTCSDVIEQDVRDGENFYNLSVFSVQDHLLVCGIIENMHAPEVRKDIVLTRTRDVINQNMKIVQKIAFLLGENASYTESMLNSIVESHTDTKQDNTKTFDL